MMCRHLSVRQKLACAAAAVVAGGLRISRVPGAEAWDMCTTHKYISRAYALCYAIDSAHLRHTHGHSVACAFSALHVQPALTSKCCPQDRRACCHQPPVDYVVCSNAPINTLCPCALAADPRPHGVLCASHAWDGLGLALRRRLHCALSASAAHRAYLHACPVWSAPQAMLYGRHCHVGTCR